VSNLLFSRREVFPLEHCELVRILLQLIIYLERESILYCVMHECYPVRQCYETNVFFSSTLTLLIEMLE